MSQLCEILQEPLIAGERETRTILALLREKMDGVDRGIRMTTRRRSLKERLGLKGMGGCGGATWGFGPTTSPTTVNPSDSEDEEIQLHHHQQQLQLLNQQDQQEPSAPGYVSDPVCSSPVPVSSRGNGMNLAAALAAERHLRAVEGPPNVDVNNNNDDNNTSSSNGSGGSGNNAGVRITAPGTPSRVSLMRLLAETDGDGEEERGGAAAEAVASVGGGNDTVCCVCMVRKKGAAFIPCGHTFCRVCSREVWLNRGSCPLCNRCILEILDIF